MNYKLIAERCQAGGVAVHEAAKRIGVDPFPFLVLGESPHADGRIPVGVLMALSQLLDIDIEDLLDTPIDPVEPGDSVRVEAALATFPTGTTRDDLARCFDWPLERVESAIAALEVRLRPTGRRVRRIGWHRYALGPNLAVLTSKQRRNLARAAARTESIDLEQATMLRQIIAGWSWPSTYGNVPEMVRALRDKGLIDDGNRHLEPSADVHFSLRLDEY